MVVIQSWIALHNQNLYLIPCILEAMCSRQHLGNSWRPNLVGLQGLFDAEIKLSKAKAKQEDDDDLTLSFQCP